MIVSNCSKVPTPARRVYVAGAVQEFLFQQVYGSELPGCTFTRLGPFMGVVWESSHDRPGLEAT